MRKTQPILTVWLVFAVISMQITAASIGAAVPTFLDPSQFITSKLPPHEIVKITKLTTTSSETGGLDNNALVPTFNDAQKLQSWHVQAGDTILMDFNCLLDQSDRLNGVEVKYALKQSRTLLSDKYLKETIKTKRICDQNKAVDSIQILTPAKVDFGDSYQIQMQYQSPIGTREILTTGEFTMYNKESELKTMESYVQEWHEPTAETFLPTNGHLRVRCLLNREIPSEHALIIRLIQNLNLNSERIWTVESTELGSYVRNNEFTFESSLLDKRGKGVSTSDRYFVKLYLKKNSRTGFFGAIADFFTSSSKAIYASPYFSISDKASVPVASAANVNITEPPVLQDDVLTGIIPADTAVLTGEETPQSQSQAIDGEINNVTETTAEDVDPILLQDLLARKKADSWDE